MINTNEEDNDSLSWCDEDETRLISDNDDNNDK